MSSSRSRAAGERLPHAESAQLLQRCLSEAPPIDLSKKPFVCVQPDSSCLFSLVGRNEYYYVFVTATSTTLFDLFFFNQPRKFRVLEIRFLSIGDPRTISVVVKVA